MTNYKDDPTLALQGESFAFWYNGDNIASVPVFGGQYGVMLAGAVTENLGDLSPLNIPSTTQPNQFTTVRVIRGAPDLNEFTIVELFKRTTRAGLERMKTELCRWNFFLPFNGCTRPDDINSWDSVMLIYGAFQSNLEWSDFRQRDGNDPIELTSSFSFLAATRVFPVTAGQQAETTVTSKVIDVMFADALSCGNCVPYSTGEQAWYALTNQSTGSPGLPSRVVYTTDNGSTYNASTITSLGTGQANKFAAVGSYIVVVSETDTSHHIALKSVLTGASPWSEVATGYVSTKGPRCITSLSPQQTYIGGTGGYVYGSTDVTAGVSVLTDGSVTTQNIVSIHAFGQTIVAGGVSNVLLLSQNSGVTWTLLTGPVIAATVNAVWVVSSTTFWAGMSDGTLWYSANAGVTWVQKLLPNQSSLTAITDIKFSPDMPVIGALTAQLSGSAVIYRTLTGGRLWSYQDPYVRNLGTAAATLGAVALAGADKILAGGEETAASDGILIVAA